MINSLNTLKISKIKSLKFLGLLFSPYFLVISLLPISFFIMPKQGMTWTNDMAYTGIRCLIIIIPMGVFLLFTHKSFALFKRDILSMA